MPRKRIPSSTQSFVSPPEPRECSREMGSRDTRREENQKLFRFGNERLRSAVNDRVPDSDVIPFLCECADEFCNGRVELRMEDWEEVLRRPQHFVMVTGHPRSEGEMVVGALDGYDIVRKPDHE